MKFVGERGIEAGAGVVVGAVASEYEEDNLTGILKRTGLQPGILSLIVGLLLLAIHQTSNDRKTLTKICQWDS